MTARVEEIGAILEHIDAHPEEWNQDDYGVPANTACGTAFCVGGHALVRAGYTTEPHRNRSHSLQFRSPTGQLINPEIDAQEVLDLTKQQADTLFAGFNTRADLQAAFEQIKADPTGDDEVALIELYVTAGDLFL